MRLLVTGAGGYLGRHVARRALAEGHAVRATLRDAAGRAEALRADLGAPPDCVEAVELDLLRDAGWDAAMAGIDGVLHTASPVPTRGDVPDDAVIRPAVEGTARVLRAAARAGVGRVVVTSSIAAILESPGKGRTDLFDARDWTDPDRPGVRAYARAKTLAEREARRIAAETPGLALATVNPGYIFGPPLGGPVTSSLTLVQMLVSGKVPALPRLSFPSVDVADVADAHLRALDAPDGTRAVASGETLTLQEIADAVRRAVPGARVPRLTLPDWAVRLAARAAPSLRMVAGSLGNHRRTDPSSCEALLGRPLADPRAAVEATARALASRAGPTP